jgi:hypothetical protein
MTHRMSLTLTDEGYAQLSEEAARIGRPIDALAHDFIVQRLTPSRKPQRPLTSREFTEQQYREGKALNLPTRAPITSEEAAERERRAQLLSGGKSASEMVIEDRGPR